MTAKNDELKEYKDCIVDDGVGADGEGWDMESEESAAIGTSDAQGKWHGGDGRGAQVGTQEECESECHDKDGRQKKEMASEEGR